MPIYEYQCGSCQHQFEALQKMSDTPLTECPECHETQLKKLVSAAAFKLKGGGWYETDFKNNNKKPKASEGEGATDFSGSKAEKSGSASDGVNSHETSSAEKPAKEAKKSSKNSGEK